MAPWGVEGWQLGYGGFSSRSPKYLWSGIASLRNTFACLVEEVIDWFLDVRHFPVKLRSDSTWKTLRDKTKNKKSQVKYCSENNLSLFLPTSHNRKGNMVFCTVISYQLVRPGQISNTLRDANNILKMKNDWQRGEKDL